MESRLGTYAQPSERGRKDQEVSGSLKKNQATAVNHVKNNPSFSKTQNISDMLRIMNIEDVDTKVLIDSVTGSHNASIQINNDSELLIEPLDQSSSLKKADKKHLISAIEAQQKRSKIINFNNKTGKIQNL
jgi:hypothetical protein